MEMYQIYWWFIVSLLGGLLVFMMFVQGGQTLLGVARDELEKDAIINSIGKKWELTFTTLVMFGGACFAAFPLFYATSFGGAYWVWMAILFCFIIQAVSYEYRKKPDNFLGQKTYEIFLFINGSLGVFLIGVAVSTFFSGSEFVLNESNFVEWKNKLRGLEALANPLNFLLGFALVFIARVGGSLYLINNIAEDSMRDRFRAKIRIDAPLLVIFLVGFLAWICTKDGFAVDANGVVSLVKYKYFQNLIDMPALFAALCLGIFMALIGIVQGASTSSFRGIFPYGLGIVLAATSLFLIAGLNGTAFYPSTTDLQSSLTITNASSSHYTLKVMSYVSLLVPVVLGYIIYVWRALDMRKLTLEELKNSKDAH